jgi:hypothetical protein
MPSEYGAPRPGSIEISGIDARPWLPVMHCARAKADSGCQEYRRRNRQFEGHMGGRPIGEDRPHR